MRTTLVTTTSMALTFMVVANAYYQKKQFYTSVIYVTKSSPSMAILYLQAFVLVYLMGKLMRKIFFGQLRPAEMEHLMERAWYAVTETCLAFTVFRDDFGTKFVTMFTVLLFLKCFHWLAEDRVDYMERSPVIHLVFHIRAVSLLVVLGLLDSLFINHAYKSTLSRGATVQLVFGFEYAILLLSVISVSLRYVLHVIDSRRETPWENKAVYLLYSDFVLAGIRVVIYLMFLFIMIRIHTLPLFAIRPIYLSMRFFKKAFHDVVMSRRAIRYMNTVFPTVTAADLESADTVCIICREEMMAGPDGGAKKLPCSHLFHAACLRSWFQRQQTCPTCRMDILRAGSQPAQQQQQRPQDPQQRQQQQQQQQQSQSSSSQPTTLSEQQQSQQQQITNPWAALFPPTFLPAAAAAAAAAPPYSTQGPIPLFGVPSSMMTPPPMVQGMNQTLPQMFGSGMPDLADVDLSSLPTESLLEMEGQGRRAVEARLETLRRIQTLLDAAVIQMQTYMMCVNVSLAAAPSPPPTESATAAAASEEPESLEKVPVERQESNDKDDIKGPEPEKETTDELICPDNADDSTNGSDALAEVRRRRLERFDSQKDTPSE